MKHCGRLSLFQNSRFVIFSSLLLVLFISSTFLFMGGCASNRGTNAVFTPVTFDSSEAVIYIYRKSRFVGAANSAELFINNKDVGRLVNGSYCVYVTKPGPVEIKALEKVSISLNLIGKLMGKQPLIEFEAAPGRDYYLEFNVAGYKVKQVSKDKALDMMSSLKPAEPPAD